MSKTLLICDSICIKILTETAVLAGVGNELRLFSIEDKNQERSSEWILEEKIHGIDFRNGKVLAYGCREFMLLEYNGDLKLINRGSISDWIICGRLLDEPLGKIMLVTGHSVALLVNCENDRKFTIEERSSCSDKSTVYCSIIVGSSLDNCAIFAGTALGELIVWKPNFHNRKPHSYELVLHRISGHNGVIFSIDINLNFGVVTTTSDDRSVRFYSIENLELARTNDIISWGNLKLIPKCSVYGHGARVFKARIIEKDGVPFVISAGEDSFICVWNLSGDMILKRRHHFGATIWDFDYNNQSGMLFSSSSDGNVKCHALKDNFFPTLVETIETNSLKPNYVAKVRFVNQNAIVAITNNNRLVFKNPDRSWEFVETYSGYKCTTLEVFEDMIAIGGYKVLTLFKVEMNGEFRKIIETPLLQNLIRSVCFLSQNELLVCDEKGNCKYSTDYFQTSQNIELPKSREPWITSALKHREFLIISNRQGHVFLYKFEDMAFCLKSTLKRVHGNLGVTCMKLDSVTKESVTVRTAGHDSTIKTLKINMENETVSIVFSENIPVVWVEKFCSGPTGTKYVTGFNDNHFIVWEQQQDVVFQVSCGGGHRCWDVSLNFSFNSLQMIFVKNKSLYTSTAQINPNANNEFKIPYSSWHIKSCNVVKSLCLNSSDIVLVSGGEDNLLKLSKFSFLTPNNLERLCDIHSHISSVKDIAICKTKSGYLTFSVGGRAQICIAEYNTDKNVVENRLNFMLKSSDYERKYQKNTQKIDFDPETRFMRIAVVPGQVDFDLYLACSDGFIRKFAYQNDAIELKAETYYGRCMLHIRTIYLENMPYLVTTATDGFISFWDLENFETMKKPVFQIKHHDSGVNSLDIRITENSFLMASGGDDQDVVVSKIYDNFQIGFTERLTFHIGQVNGVRFSDDLKFLYTVSVDQCIYQIELTSFELIKKTKTCVADVKGFELISHGKVDYFIVYGWGVQICKL